MSQLIKPKSKEELSKALSSNLPAVVVPDSSSKPSEGQLDKDTETDYKFAREKLKGLIEKSEEALETLAMIARDAEHPRAYEVLSTMLKNTAEITEQLLSLQKRRKDLVKAEAPTGPAAGTTTNNTIFVGSTSELQKLLRKEKAAIDGSISV